MALGQKQKAKCENNLRLYSLEKALLYCPSGETLKPLINWQLQVLKW